MHVLAAFVIFIGLFSGFYQKNQIPEEQINLIVDSGQHVKIRVKTDSLDKLKHADLVSQTYDYSCGSAALATVLNFRLGEKFTERQVIQGLLQYGDSKKIAKRRAFSLLDMKRFVNALGYKGVGYKAEFEDLKTLEEPCIIPIKIFGYRHFAVFKGIYKGHVFLADPWRGNTSYTSADFLSKWYQNVIFIIYPQNGTGLKYLELDEKDLSYIDEDAARRIIFDKALYTIPEIDRQINNLPGKFQLYKP